MPLKQHSLFTTAVAKIAAMPACCGRSWMSERSAAGYSGSSFTTGCFWVTRLSGGDSWSRGEEELAGGGNREARSSSPATSSLVTLQNSSSPENTQTQLWLACHSRTSTGGTNNINNGSVKLRCFSKAFQWTSRSPATDTPDIYMINYSAVKNIYRWLP